MAMEIEKKFLLNSNDWRDSVVESHMLLQDYVKYNGENARIRINLTKCSAQITQKGESRLINNTLAREEKEFSVDFAHWLRKVLQTNTFLIKKRNYVKFNQFLFEVDEFMNLSDSKLVMAEVEFKNEKDIEVFNKIEKPSWLGLEVSGKTEYENFNLHKKVKM